MEENRHDFPEQDHYQTGSTQPPKSYGGIITVLLVLVVVLCGMVSFLSIENIRLMGALNSANLSSLSDSTAPSSTAPTQGTPGGQPSLGIAGEKIGTVSQHFYRIPAGIYITRVSNPAKQQGIRIGDILLTVNGQRITDLQQLEQATTQCQIGQTAQVTVYRNGSQLSLALPIGEELP